MKRTRIYVNEQLTQNNAALFKKARDLRKHGNIDNTWTYNGKVFLKKSQSTSPNELKVEEDLLQTVLREQKNRTIFVYVLYLFP